MVLAVQVGQFSPPIHLAASHSTGKLSRLILDSGQLAMQIWRILGSKFDANPHSIALRAPFEGLRSYARKSAVIADIQT